MKVNFLVAAKLSEVVTRGIFIIFCTYALPLIDAGVFGLLVTFIGFFAFLLGFERYIDVQRKVSGLSKEIILGEIRRLLPFLSVHYPHVSG